MPRATANPRLGYALVVSGAALFIVNAGVSRVAMRAGVEPGVLTTARVTGAAALFVGWAALVRPSVLRPPTGRTLLNLVILGVIGVAGVQWTYNVAIDRVPVGIALLLEYLAPVLVVLWARFVQRKRVRDRMWLAVAASLVGLAIISRAWQGLTFDGVGVLAGLGAAICLAVYFLMGEHGVGSQDPLRVVLWSFVLAAVAMNCVHPIWGLEVGSESTSLLGALDGLSAPVWLLLGWIVVLGTLLPFFLELNALSHLPATVVTVVATLEPVGAAALGWAWFGESLTVVQVLGGVLVLTGIGLAQTARTQPAEGVVPEVAP
ncbi:MAG: EamA family transporter [Nocardioidaceae bacterium]